MYARRIEQLKPSFIREILKVTGNQKIISFAGGLPNSELFPIEEIEQAAIITSRNRDSMQYSQTEGHQELRRFIASRYYQNVGFDASNILITNGSQQALDLLGKLFIDKDDKIIIEAPGYLGAIQALAVYEPEFLPVPLDDDGLNLLETQKRIQQNPKLMYTVPNFQNPSGISYSETRKSELLDVLKDTSIFIIEDNPYGELNYSETSSKRFVDMQPDKTISLGSFSKVFVPAMRLGWVAATSDVIDKLTILKQSADLHTNYYAQCLVVNYLAENDLDQHINKIRNYYKNQMTIMLNSLGEYLPKGVTYTKPTGGMFIWLNLPKTIDSFNLLELCKEQGVIFVPGSEFHVDGQGKNTLRLNFTNSTEEEITLGIQILATYIDKIV